MWQDSPSVVAARSTPPTNAISRALLAFPAIFLVYVAVLVQRWWVVLAGAAVVALEIRLIAGLKRRVVAFRADRLEITADRLTLIGPAGVGTELIRRPGDVLAFSRDRSAGWHLRLLGPSGPSGYLNLAHFDVDQVRAACVAHGWSWHEPDAPAARAHRQPLVAPEPHALTSAPRPTAPPLAPPARPPMPAAPGMPPPPPMPPPPMSARPRSVEIVVRDGRDLTQPSRRSATLVTSLLFGATTSFVVVGVVVWQEPWVMAAALLPATALVGYGFLSVRLSGAMVEVAADRVKVRYGSQSTRVALRSAVASGVVGERWVRLKDLQGRQVMWVPLRPKRDEVLSALATFGWPLAPPR